MIAEIDQLRFPIGKFKAPDNITSDDIEKWISELEQLPADFKDAVNLLKPEQLNTPYRPEGWTLLQVVHHVADSHMNSYIRFKLAASEDSPTIKPYFEDKWAHFEDGKNAAVEISLTLLQSLHSRWVLFLRSLKPEDFNKGFVHPEHGNLVLLKEALGMYAWHGKHHLHHILQTKKLQGW